ncbi:hypothetical protein D3C78_941680 [compost metagenome]
MKMERYLLVLMFMALTSERIPVGITVSIGQAQGLAMHAALACSRVFRVVMSKTITAQSTYRFASHCGVSGNRATRKSSMLRNAVGMCLRDA